MNVGAADVALVVLREFNESTNLRRENSDQEAEVVFSELLSNNKDEIGSSHTEDDLSFIHAESAYGGSEGNIFQSEPYALRINDKTYTPSVFYWMPTNSLSYKIEHYAENVGVTNLPNDSSYRENLRNITHSQVLSKAKAKGSENTLSHRGFHTGSSYIEIHMEPLRVKARDVSASYYRAAVPLPDYEKTKITVFNSELADEIYVRDYFSGLAGGDVRLTFDVGNTFTSNITFNGKRLEYAS